MIENIHLNLVNEFLKSFTKIILLAPQGACQNCSCLARSEEIRRDVGINCFKSAWSPWKGRLGAMNMNM